MVYHLSFNDPEYFARIIQLYFTSPFLFYPDSSYGFINFCFLVIILIIQKLNINYLIFRSLEY